MWLNEEPINGFFSSATEFVNRAKAKGYKWVTMQVNDGGTGHEQRAKVPEYQAACEGHLIFTIWLTRPFDGAFARQMAIESNCRGILLEAEIPSESLNPQTGEPEPRPEAVNWVEVIFHLQDLPISKGVVTNFAPFVHWDGSPWPEKARPLIYANYACVTENFISESPNSTPANTDHYATTKLGWPRTQPMIEGWRIPEYGDLSMYENVSHWDAGNVL